MIYAQLILMRTLAVVLVAWPTTFALSRFVVDHDFFWFSLILGCPLFALSLWHHSRQLLPVICAQRLLILVRPFPFALHQKRRQRILEKVTRITAGSGMRMRNSRPARAA